MEWGDVRIFLAAARLGTLGAAARALNLSHPTIGRRLRALEEATGQTLFQRTSEGLILTDEGEEVFTLAERMEESALGIARRLAGEGAQLAGLLRLSSSDWFGAYVLPPVLMAFAERYPSVTVELITSAQLFNLSRREADVAFRIVPFAEPEIVQRRLMHMRYGLYIAADQPDPRLGDGGGMALITMDGAKRPFPDVAWLRALFPNARVALQSNNRNVQAQMCARGLGLAVLPRPVGDALPTLRRLDQAGEPPGRDIWLGYHRDLRRLERLRALVDTAVGILSGIEKQPPK